MVQIAPEFEEMGGKSSGEACADGHAFQTGALAACLTAWKTLLALIDIGRVSRLRGNR